MLLNLQQGNSVMTFSYPGAKVVSDVSSKAGPLINGAIQKSTPYVNFAVENTNAAVTKVGDKAKPVFVAAMEKSEPYFDSARNWLLNHHEDKNLIPLII
jgi:hypothetical protein